MAFLYHRSAILSGAFGGPGPLRLAVLTQVPAVIGYLVGLAQFAGSVAILTGIMIRAGAACIIVVMLGAILLVHLAPGFDINQGGTQCAVAVTYRFGTVADRRA